MSERGGIKSEEFHIRMRRGCTSKQDLKQDLQLEQPGDFNLILIGRCWSSVRIDLI